jgi:hypothetical protein
MCFYLSRKEAKNEKHPKNEKAPRGGNPVAPSPPTNGPYPSKSGATLRRRTMSLSHSRKNPSTVTPAGKSGADALRAYFFPRQVLRLNETAQCLGLSYSRFYRRVEAGTLTLRIQKNEVGERYVLLDDLIHYLFGPPTEQANSSPQKVQKRGPGRPRSTEGGAR